MNIMVQQNQKHKYIRLNLVESINTLKKLLKQRINESMNEGMYKDWMKVWLNKWISQ